MDNLGIIFYTYLFVINVITFILYALDKRCAYYGLWRTPEALLLVLAVIGGAYGAGAGMLLFRHKTLHKSFRLTVPISFILWMIAVVLLWIF